MGTDWACCLPAHLQRRLHGLADANHSLLPRGTESNVMKRAVTSNWNALVNLCRVAAGKYEHRTAGRTGISRLVASGPTQGTIITP